jgi:pSer/pThr/pTyr-binding forkhead associated (FHA) protein
MEETSSAHGGHRAMSDETIYKRDEKGKKVSKSLHPKHMRIRFKDKDIDVNRLITIGRDPKSDIVVKDDPLVSRKHALIEKEGSHYYIMDKGSTNGSYLNNNPLPRCERVRISPGDVIIVGKTKLEIL